MLNNIEFIQESIGTNLFYLRNLRDFSLTIYLSLPSNFSSYRDRIQRIGIESAEVGRTLVNNSSLKISKNILDYNFFVTPYTLNCEKLTQKLFDTLISTDITLVEEKLEPGVLTSTTDDMIKTFSEINLKAKNIANNFLSLVESLINDIQKNNVFLYLYPSIIDFMINEVRVYIDELDRVQNRIQIDPSEVVNSEFSWNNSMINIALFINKLIDPSNMDIINKSSQFIEEFRKSQSLYKSTPLTPQNQLFLTNKEYSLVTDFSNFISNCIKELLDSKTYFIINAVFLDTMYTEVNFFLYRLDFNKKNSTT